MAKAKKDRVFLVTGATGMVGGHVAETLRAQYATVRCLVRKNSDTAFLESIGVEFCYGDVTDTAAVDAAVKGADVVFHCAAMVSDWASREEMERVNVGGTQNIIDACLKYGVQRMVMVSSLAVLGMGKQINANETAPYVYTGDNYNYTKIESEKRVLAAIREKKLPGVIVRPPYIYGPRDRQLLPRVVQFLKEKKFKFIGGGANPISLVYVKNLVDVMMRAAESEKAVGQVYHVTDGTDISRKEFITELAQKLGYEVPTQSVPEGVAKMLCPVLEWVNKVTGSKEPPLLNKFKMKFMVTYLTFDISKAKNELGYNPAYTYKQGLEETVAWFKSQKEEPAGVS
ncbi:MAG: NAD-dependent epimerase/dehydratase family protein [Candidatus Auribacterota bacterium]